MATLNRDTLLLANNIRLVNNINYNINNINNNTYINNINNIEYYNFNVINLTRLVDSDPYQDLHLNLPPQLERDYRCITCPICKVKSTYDFDWDTSCAIPELESTCPICMEPGVNTRLACGHCLCRECTYVLMGLTQRENPVEDSTIEHATCKTCNLVHENFVAQRIYGVDTPCPCCQTEEVGILLPCRHYSCMKCM